MCCSSSFYVYFCLVFLFIELMLFYLSNGIISDSICCVISCTPSALSQFLFSDITRTPPTFEISTKLDFSNILIQFFIVSVEMLSAMMKKKSKSDKSVKVYAMNPCYFFQSFQYIPYLHLPQSTWLVISLTHALIKSLSIIPQSRRLPNDCTTAMYVCEYGAKAAVKTTRFPCPSDGSVTVI